MNILVHLLIARSVRATVYRSVGVKLRAADFFYGNILPDLSQTAGQAPHFLKDSLEYVLQSAEKLRDASAENATGFGTWSRNVGDYQSLSVRLFLLRPF